MATINSKKLLPPSKKSKQVFLVPSTSIVPSTSLSVKKLKPVDQKESSQDNFIVIKGKIIKITDLFKNNLLLTKKSNERKRKDSEKEKASQREKKLETKDLKGPGGIELLGKVPGSSIFDRLSRFAGFTFLGFLYNNYSNLLPKLIELGKNLKPAIETFDYFAKGLVDNSITFIEKGYEAYDKLREITKTIGGQGAAKVFDNFSGTLNKFLNYTLILAMAFRPPKRPPGGGAGSGFVAGLLTGLGLGGAARKFTGPAASKILQRVSSSRSTAAGKRLFASDELFKRARQERSLQRLREKKISAQRLREREVAGVGTGRGAGAGVGLADAPSGAPRGKKNIEAMRQRGFRPGKIYGFGGKIDPKTFSIIENIAKTDPDLAQKIANNPNSPLSKQVIKHFERYGTQRRFTSSMAGKTPTPAEVLSKKPSNVPIKSPSGIGGIVKFAAVGALIDFVFKLASGEKPTRAAATSIGAAAGGIIGGAIGTAVTGGLAFFSGGFGALLAPVVVGTSSILGATALEALVGAIYDFAGQRFGFSQGGQVTRGGRKKTAPSRQIRRVVSKPKRVQPQRTQPGRDVGGIKKIENLYGQDKPGQKSGLRVLKNTSSYLKGVSVLNGSLGSIMGASVDLAMGQKFDKKTIKSIGDQFGFAIQNMVDNQVTMSLGDISKQIAMANGGVVPSRRIGGGLSVGSKVSLMISNAFSSMMESASGKILNNIMREMGMMGGVGAESRTPFGDVPPAEISQDQRKAADDLIKYFTKLYGRNAAVGIVANLLRESGLRTYAPEGGFHGMAQWDDNRWSKFTAWANSKGKDPMSRSAQAEWIAIELNQSGTGNRLKKATTPEDAASIFYNEFERAAYSRPILGSAYTPDNPHEQKNRGFIAALVGGASAPAAMVSGGVKPTDIRQTSPQGWRWGKMHKGVDLDGGDGSPISSAQDAKVIWAGDKGDGYGNSVVLRYSNGAETRFAHLKSFNVSNGSSIKAGQLIGRQGNTGSSTASHLHFEYYPSGGAMTYEGYGNAASVMNSYFRYGGNVVPKITNKPADIFNIQSSPEEKNKPSSIFNWNQSSLGPIKPKSTDVAMDTSYSKNGLVISEINTLLYQKEIVLT